MSRDSHSARVFENPRWAADLEEINASLCITCHAEHRRAAGGVTVDSTFCFPCHDDVVEKRQSHRNFAAESCGQAGCHNYHDNQTLNTAFLSRERGKPELLQPALLARWNRTAEGQVRPAAGTPAETPSSLPAPEEVTRAHAGSAHARAGVGCGDCHGNNQQLVLRPGIESCQRCHSFEASTFKSGRHGSRHAVELAPLSPREGRLPMKPPSAAQPAALTCGACHDVHTVDTRPAATTACLRCHDDEHSRGFEASPHAALPGKEEAASETAVTCATCHLPRVEVEKEGGRVAVHHNNSLTLRPTDRMVRLVCLRCHSLELGLESVLDRELVTANFRGRPRGRHQTFELIESNPPNLTGGQPAPGGSR